MRRKDIALIKADNSMAQVFISYAREDLIVARRIRDDLKSVGIQTWFDEDDLLPGQNWRAEIVEAIGKSRYFLALLSNNSVGKRGFVQKELKQALDVLDEFSENDVFIVPVRIEECTPTYKKLKDLHRVDLFPDWNLGLEKIHLTMEISSDEYNISFNDDVAHPKDKLNHISGTWVDGGLEINGGNLIIPANDSMRLFRVWADWVPQFVERQTVELGVEDAYEQAFITGVIRAFYEVFNVVASEDEMERGSSILSRKMSLFYSFAREMYTKARERGIDPKEYLFNEQNDSLKENGEVGAEDKRNFYRTLLHAYVSRLCDVNLDRVEAIETAMREALPERGGFAAPWEDLVESIYEVDESMVLKAYRGLKKEKPGDADEEIVDAIISFFIESTALEEYSSLE